MHREFMLEAVREGKRVRDEGIGEPFGAVVAKDGRIVSVAGNQCFALKTPTAHAELMAINLACEKLGVSDLDGCVVYASGQPCVMCLSAMLITGVRTVYYANTHAEIGYDPAPSVDAVCGVYGASGADPCLFQSVPMLEIRYFPLDEAKELL